MLDVKIAPSWKEQLAVELTKPYVHQLADFVKSEYRQHTIYPPAQAVWRAFALSSFSATKVVLLGQDPYHGPGQANGLCFAVNPGVSIPPSLRNIFTERQHDLGIPIPQTGNLDAWAQQGVLLLNATLTVRAHQPGSHQNKGWEIFTDAVIRHLAHAKQQIVFMLWGAYAQRKAHLIDPNQHLIVSAAHPSPYAADRGFFGSRPFSKANQYLQATEQVPIQW